MDTPFSFERCIKDLDVEETVDLYWHRRLAFWLVLKPIERLDLRRVTPMQITLLSIVIGVLAGVVSGMTPSAGPKMCLYGAGLLLVHVVLDCADGMLARLRGGGSRFGMLVDGLGDMVVGVAYWAGLSRTMAAQLEGPWVWPALLTILLSIVVHTALYDSIKTKFVAATTPHAPVAPAATNQPVPGAIERGIERIYAFYQASAKKVGKFDLERPAQTIDPQRARVALRPAMRAIASIGLGTSLFVMYISALLVPLWPTAPLWFGLVGLAGVGNVVMVIAIVRLKRGERALA